MLTKNLILTGHPKTWLSLENLPPEKQPWFLGPWCFAHNPSAVYTDCLNHLILPDPWKNSDEILETKKYLDDLCERLMPALHSEFNKMHGLQKSEKFWRKICLYWLVTWTGILFDRHTRLKAAGKFTAQKFKWHVELPKILSRGNFNTYPEIMTEIDKHPINACIFADLLAYGKFPDFEMKTDAFEIDLTSRQNLTSHQPLTLRKKVGGFVRGQLKKGCVRIGNIQGIRPIEKFLLAILLEPFLVFRKAPTVKTFPSGDSYSIELGAHFHPKNDFEETLIKVLPLWIPRFLRFKYEFSGSHTKAFVGNDISLHPAQTWEIADICERGGKWICTQHGAGYGQLKAMPVGKVEYGESDFFLSWGWTQTHNYAGNIRRFPSPHLSKLPQRRKKPTDDHWLMLSSTHPTYHYRFHAALMPNQLPAFQNIRLQFLQSLNPEMLEKLRLKLYYNDFGTSELLNIKNRIPSIRLADTSTRSIGPMALLSSQFTVVDHFGTSIAEAMAANVPILGFWDPEMFAADPMVEPLLTSMKKEKMLFETPKEMAAHLNSYAHEIPNWWFSSSVQNVRKNYVEQHAYYSKNWRSQWIPFLKKLTSIPKVL